MFVWLLKVWENMHNMGARRKYGESSRNWVYISIMSEETHGFSWRKRICISTRAYQMCLDTWEWLAVEGSDLGRNPAYLEREEYAAQYLRDVTEIERLGNIAWWRRFMSRKLWLWSIAQSLNEAVEDRLLYISCRDLREWVVWYAALGPNGFIEFLTVSQEDVVVHRLKVERSLLAQLRPLKMNSIFILDPCAARMGFQCCSIALIQK